MNRPSRKAKEKALHSKIQQKRIRTSGSFNSTIQDCVICLDNVTTRGLLSVCDHWFCFTCVYEWAKKTNTCPLCKTRFRAITKVHLDVGKSPQKVFRIKDKEQSFINYHEDDYQVAMGLLSNSESENTELENNMDETFQPSSSNEHTNFFGRRRRRRRPSRRSSQLNFVESEHLTPSNSQTSRNSQNQTTSETTVTTETDSPVTNIENQSNSSSQQSSQRTSALSQNTRVFTKKRKKRKSIVFNPKRNSAKRIRRPPTTSDGWINMSRKPGSQDKRSSSSSTEDSEEYDNIDDQDDDDYDDEYEYRPSRERTSIEHPTDGKAAKNPYGNETNCLKNRLRTKHEKEDSDDTQRMTTLRSHSTNGIHQMPSCSKSETMPKTSSVARFNVKSFLDSSDESDVEENESRTFPGDNCFEETDILHSPGITKILESPICTDKAKISKDSTIRTPDILQTSFSEISFTLDDSSASFSEISPCVLSQHDQTGRRTSCKTLGIRNNIRIGNRMNLNTDDTTNGKSSTRPHVFPSYMNVKRVQVSLDSATNTKPVARSINNDTYANKNDERENNGCSSKSIIERTRTKRFRFVRSRGILRSPLKDIPTDSDYIPNTPQSSKFKFRWK